MSEQTRPTEQDVRRLERQARQQMQEIQRLLVPNLRDLARVHLRSAEISGLEISQQMKQMTPADREQLQFRLSLALADLTSTQQAMEQYRNLIAVEIRRHHAAQRAQASYARSRQHQRPH